MHLLESRAGLHVRVTTERIHQSTNQGREEMRAGQLFTVGSRGGTEPAPSTNHGYSRNYRENRDERLNQSQSGADVREGNKTPVRI